MKYVRALAIIAIVQLCTGTASVCARNDSVDVRRHPEHEFLKDLVQNTKVTFIGKADSTDRPSNDSVISMITKFYVDQFRHFQDPRAPYFMFMSKDANLAMGVGGVVRMRGWFDWNGSIQANGFSPYLINIPKDPANMRRLAATPAGCAIFMTIMGRRTRVGDFIAYLEGNFDGYQHVGFKLKKAYVTVNDWTIGYAPSTFSDSNAQPPTIDGAGPNGRITHTNILVRYMHTFGNRWSVAGSFEFPDSHPDITDGQTKKCSDYVPDLCVMGQYQWDDGLSHVRLSGLLRVMPYRDLIAGKTRNVIGWGVQLSSMFKLFRPLTVYAMANIGQGHASYLGDMSIGNYDLVGYTTNPGKLYAPTSFGLTFGLKYNFRKNIYACIALSEMRYLPKHHINNNDYKYGLYSAVNLFWDITPRFQTGIEYLCGKRMNFNRTHANANRIDALFQFSF